MGWFVWLVHFLGQSAAMVFLTGLLTAAQYIKSPFALYLTMRASNMIAQFCFTISHKRETHTGQVVLGCWVVVVVVIAFMVIIRILPLGELFFSVCESLPSFVWKWGYAMLRSCPTKLCYGISKACFRKNIFYSISVSFRVKILAICKLMFAIFIACGKANLSLSVGYD